MTHTIDTKAIQELAATCPEARAYLEREFPSVFTQGDYWISIGGDYLIKEESNTFTVIPAMKLKIGKTYSFPKADRIATTEEIQRFIPDYKPNV